MPDESLTVPPQPVSVTPVAPKKSINWKLIGIIVVITAVLIGGFGYAAVVLDIFGTKTEETLTPVRQSSPSEKVQTIPELFAFSRDTEAESKVATGSAQTKGNEVWIYDSGKTSQVTETGSVSKFELSSDGKTLYYIKNEAINESLVGVELHSISLDSKKDRVLVPEIKIDKETAWNYSLTDFDLSNDETKVAFTRRGVWTLDLKTNKISKLVSGNYCVGICQAHAYDGVNWSPSGKYLHLLWGGYEVSGDEIMELATKKITKLYSGFPGEYEFLDFIDDKRGIFSREERDMVEKEFANLKKDYPVLVLDRSLGTRDVNTSDIGKVNGFLEVAYTASQDRIYYIRSTIVKVTGEGGFVTEPQVVYFDRKKGTTIKISESLSTASETNNLFVFADGKYVIFDLKSDPDDAGIGFNTNEIWAVSTDGKVQSRLVENAFSPAAPSF